MSFPQGIEVGWAHYRKLAEIRRADQLAAAEQTALDEAAEARAYKTVGSAPEIYEEQERIMAHAAATERQEAIDAQAARAKWLGELEDQRDRLLENGQGRWRTVAEVLAASAGRP